MGVENCATIEKCIWRHEENSEMNVEKSWDKLFGFLREIQAKNKPYDEVNQRLQELPEYVQQLVWYDDVMPEGSGGFVHYTTWENMLKIFNVQEGEIQKEKKSMLRMYNYEYANDPEEGKIKPPEWEKLERKAKVLLHKYDSEGSEERTRGGSIYGCSFSTNGKGVEDDLMFWRLYGNNGEGCSLKLGSKLSGMYKVRYRDQGGKRKRKEMAEDREVASRMNSLLEIGEKTIEAVPDLHKVEMGRSIARVLGQVLDGYSHLVKNKAHQHEQEWRMIRAMPGREDVKYDVSRDRIVRRYIERGQMKDLFISSSEITLGPRVPNVGAARDYIEAIAKEHGMKYTKVRVSSRKYR